MDLDAIKSDAYAELGLELGWGDDDDGTRDLKHDIIEAIVPFVAASVARATADAIADKIADMRCIYAPGDVFAQGWIEGRDHGVTVARAHGRTPETETTEATE